MAAYDKVTGALDASGEVTLYGKVVALDGGAGDYSFFGNEDITASLNVTIPVFANTVII